MEVNLRKQTACPVALIHERKDDSSFTFLSGKGERGRGILSKCCMNYILNSGGCLDFRCIEWETKSISRPKLEDYAVTSFKNFHETSHEC